VSFAKKPLFPGWKMTVDQHGLLFRLWRDACARQGWDKLSSAERDLKRKEQLRAVFGFEKSFTELNTKGDCDLFFARLKFLADNLQGAREDQDPEPGQRRRYMHRIGELLSEFDEVGQLEYVEPILKERFKRFKGLNTIGDLNTEDLHQMVMTLDSRLRQIVKGPPGPLSWIMPRLPRFRKRKDTSEAAATMAPVIPDPAFQCDVASTEPELVEEPF